MLSQKRVQCLQLFLRRCGRVSNAAPVIACRALAPEPRTHLSVRQLVRPQGHEPKRLRRTSKSACRERASHLEGSGADVLVASSNLCRFLTSSDELSIAQLRRSRSRVMSMD